MLTYSEACTVFTLVFMALGLWVTLAIKPVTQESDTRIFVIAALLDLLVLASVLLAHRFSGREQMNLIELGICIMYSMLVIQKLSKAKRVLALKKIPSQ